MTASRTYLDNSEFILSKLDDAITRARGIEVISWATTAGLGVASFCLALSAVVPVSDVGLVRGLLLASAVIPIVTLYWLIRRLMRNRKVRIDLLRKWQRETFLERKSVDSLEAKNVRRIIELVQLMEDSNVSGSPRYSYLDKDFMTILGGEAGA